MNAYAQLKHETRGRAVANSCFHPIQRSTTAGPRPQQLAALRESVNSRTQVRDVARMQAMINDRARTSTRMPKTKNNTGLPDNLKASLETLSRMPMDNVKVEYNSSKPFQYRALAITQGKNIHIAPGQERHLPHEAWHVVQQKQGRVPATTQMRGTALNTDPALEREADVMGARAAQTYGNLSEI